MTKSADTTAYLGIGSNMGEREAQIEAALGAIDRLPQTHITRKSPVYGSKPWGKTDQDDYLNMVVEVNTQLEPHKLLRHLQNIEKELGREEGEKWGPRPIDIDILSFGSRQIRTASLIVPHPHMWERHFVLRPLADLQPDATSPEGKPIQSVLEQEKIASQGVWRHEAAKSPAS